MAPFEEVRSQVQSSLDNAKEQWEAARSENPANPGKIAFWNTWVQNWTENLNDIDRRAAASEERRKSSKGVDDTRGTKNTYGADDESEEQENDITSDEDVAVELRKDAYARKQLEIKQAEDKKQERILEVIAMSRQRYEARTLRGRWRRFMVFVNWLLVITRPQRQAIARFARFEFRRFVNDWKGMWQVFKIDFARVVAWIFAFLRKLR